MNLAGNIARLRRARDMTQEVLAEMIGVSPQSVSKWENSTTYPDITLLPMLADAFGVTVDALYGRDGEQECRTADAAINHVVEQVRRTIAALSYTPELDGSFEDALAKYRTAMQQDECRSVIENSSDVLYFREKLGALVLRKPEDGWHVLFANDRSAELLRILADKDFRMAMRVILQRRMLNFTMPSLMKAAGVTDEANLERCIRESGLFVRRELKIDEAPLIYYELSMAEQQLFLIYAILALAQEKADYQPVHYCFFGNSDYFLP